MIQNEPLPLWALSVGVVIPFVAILAVCICGCKKSVPKNELQGLAGMVKITNPEETLNHNHSQNENRTVPVTINDVISVEIADGNRRASATVNRSLPAIPSDNERVRLGENTIWENELNGDTSSELYATVGDSKQALQSSDNHQGNRASNDTEPLESQLTDVQDNQHNSLNKGEDFNHYARLKAEHPYDKLKKSEHPYAQLRSSVNNHDNEEPGPSHINSRVGEDADASHHSSNSETPTNKNPVPPPRTRKSTSHNPVATTDNLASDTLVVIPAATAIAGRISANQELPYMTPPIPTTNFSGDSQDSKGYTSISVREPLANIKAQIKASTQRNQPMELMDSHYATVSDDSDEMYAAIEEPGQLYTSGSETYAQIQPSSTLEPVLSVEPLSVNEGSSYPPQPPSVDSLKHVAQAHSRQASSSSATSSVANLGSPKPEKRQANSPLPPPPSSGSPDIYSADRRTLLASSDSMNLEEMYAKVMKKKRTAENDVVENSHAETSGSMPRLTAEIPQNHVSVSQECLRTSQEFDRTSVCSTEIMEDSNILLPNSDIQPQAKPHSPVNTNYENAGTSISGKGRYVDPGYEVVESHDALNSVNDEASSKHSNFTEDMCNSAVNTSNFCNNNSTYSINNDNNNNENRTESDCYPRYESVNPIGGCSDDHRDFTGFGDDTGEPNYESMPSEETEHSYAGVHGVSGDSEVDPNYEMVENEDPNYESVNYFEANNDPPYERLQNEARDSDTDMIPGYEQVRHHSNIQMLEYQNVHSPCNIQMDGSSEPGYEEVGRKKPDTHSDVWRREMPVSGNVSSVSSVHPEIEPTKLGDGEIYMNVVDDKKICP